MFWAAESAFVCSLEYIKACFPNESKLFVKIFGEARDAQGRVGNIRER
jgi:hypothetical protein